MLPPKYPSGEFAPIQTMPYQKGMRNHITLGLQRAPPQVKVAHQILPDMFIPNQNHQMMTV